MFDKATFPDWDFNWSSKKDYLCAIKLANTFYIIFNRKDGNIKFLKESQTMIDLQWTIDIPWFSQWLNTKGGDEYLILGNRFVIDSSYDTELRKGVFGLFKSGEIVVHLDKEVYKKAMADLVIMMEYWGFDSLKN